MRRNERNISEIGLIEEIIKKAEVCRIGIANDNIPYLVSMNFGYEGNSERRLYFHCANEGRKLEMIKKNPVVCFGMDVDHQIYTGIKGCDWGMKYSSVVGYGIISVITDKKEKKKGMDSIMNHYGGEKEYSYDDRVFDGTTILRLVITEMTGKKC